MASAHFLFQLRNLKKFYAGRGVLDIPALSIHQGELLAIVGPSGAGKSTLLRLLHFLEPPTSGEIKYRGQAISFPPPLATRREISMVFQRPEMIDGTVLENVNLGLRLQGKQDNDRVRETLKQVDLSDLKDSPAHTLSGGEIQRVALARTIVLRPRVLLLDEPTANIDLHNVTIIENITQGLHQNYEATIVLVTHNVFQARRLADRVGFLLGGSLIEVSSTEKFFTSPSDPRSLAFVRGEMVY